MLKQFIVIFLNIFFCNICNSQNLNFDQILSLRTKSLSNVEEYLTSNKWELLEANEPKDDKMGSINFAYNKSRYDDKAESFIYFYYSNVSTSNNRLLIQVNKISNYNTYLAKIKFLGYKLLKTYVEDGDLIKIYQTNSTTIKIKTSTI